MSGVRKKRWKGPLPVSAIQGVLLKDNRFADMMLDDRLKQLRIDRGRAKNLLEWQQQSFVLNQAIKETELREMHVGHTSFLPEVTMKVTEPAVRARRPFGKVRRSAAQMMEDLAVFEKRYSLPDLTTSRSLTMSEISLSSSAPSSRRSRGSSNEIDRLQEPRSASSFIDKTKMLHTGRENFTHLHGIDLRTPRKSATGRNLPTVYKRARSLPESNAHARLSGKDLPLYGPEAEAEREERGKRRVRRLQRKMRELNVNDDTRFKRLEQSLVKDAPETEDGEEEWKKKTAGLSELLKSAGEKADAINGKDIDVTVENDDDQEHELFSDVDDSDNDDDRDDEGRLYSKSTLDLEFAGNSFFD